MFTMTRKEAEEEITTRVSHRRTICEVFREMWDIVDCIPHEVVRKELKEKIIDGFIMGKKMNAKLIEYKFDTESLSDRNENFREDYTIRCYRIGG